MKLHIEGTKFVIEPETSAEEDYLWAAAKQGRRIAVSETDLKLIENPIEITETDLRFALASVQGMLSVSCESLENVIKNLDFVSKRQPLENN